MARYKHIKEFPNYLIYDDGRVWSIIKGIFKRPKIHNDYLYVTFPKGKTRSLHRLVAMGFVKNPKPLEYNVVCHEDHNKLNNHYTNLKWGDSDYNLHQTTLHLGYHPCQGERAHYAKLTEIKVIKIRRSYKRVLSYFKGKVSKANNYLGQIYKVSGATIGRIVRRKIWKHVENK